jgi:EF hand
MSAKILSPKMLLIAAAALAASTAATLPALAAAPGQPDQQSQPDQVRPVPLRAQIMFNLIDRNSDGSIDQDEIAALSKAIFSAIDKDSDGKLSKDEFQQIAEHGPGFGPEMRGPGMRGMRGPGGEGMRGPDGMGGFFFHRGGPDGRQGQMDGGPGAGPQDRMMQQGYDQGAQPPAAGGPTQDFASLDKNGDGVISPDEFAAGAPAMPGLTPNQ